MKDLQHPNLEDVPLAAVLHALSDPVRLRIVAMAASHEELPCQAFLDSIAKSTASHHWKVLRESGLIYQRMDGTKKLNSLRRAEMEARFPGLLNSVLGAVLQEET